MGQIVKVDQRDPEEDVLDRAADVLREDGVVILPTDSVYGICCVARPDNPAHARIFDIKRRDPAQTLPIFVAEGSDLDRYGAGVPGWAHRLTACFWPGALTVVVRASREMPAEYVRQDTGTVALRVPDSALVRELVRRCGPLAQTSANTHGAPSAIDGAEVEERLVRMADLVLDGGPARIAVASTIVDCTSSQPRILREGAIPATDIQNLL